MPRRMWRLIANPLGRLAPRREIAFSLVLGTDDFGALPRINWNRWIQTGKFCNIGDTRSRTDFQFPRCRTIKLQSANTISTAAPRENEYSKVASLKSKCQSALRRRRTEEGGLVVGGGEREREGEGGKRKQNEKDFWSGCVIDVTSRWPRIRIFDHFRRVLRNVQSMFTWQVDLENFSLFRD